LLFCITEELTSEGGNPTVTTIEYRNIWGKPTTGKQCQPNNLQVFVLKNNLPLLHLLRLVWFDLTLISLEVNIVTPSPISVGIRF
jgi:hypothetical protein